jgi:hypothetical protein
VGERWICVVLDRPEPADRSRRSECPSLSSPSLAAAIQHDTGVVPRGAYATNAEHRVVENRLFSGLSAADLRGASSSPDVSTSTAAAWAPWLLHLRVPEGPSRKGALDRVAALGTGAFRSVARSAIGEGCAGARAETNHPHPTHSPLPASRAPGAGDFLDPIAEDEHAALKWRVRVEEDAARLTVRSLEWPGYVFSAELDGPRFGGAYFGDGLRNADLHFCV